jgi:hypothetical protein
MHSNFSIPGTSLYGELMVPFLSLDSPRKQTFFTVVEPPKRTCHTNISEKLDSELYVRRFRSFVLHGVVPSLNLTIYPTTFHSSQKITVISIPSCISIRSFFLIKLHNQFPCLIKSAMIYHAEPVSGTLYHLTHVHVSILSYCNS